MKARDFISKLDDKHIVSAIQKAEQTTSGEIRVFVSRQEPEDAIVAAQAQFTALEMHKTSERNGVLIYVAPRVQRFAVVGDQAVHEKCGQEFWELVAREMTGHFKKSEFTQGILHGVHKAGELLARHFPGKPGDKNELSDEIGRD
ncbi:TPM domain-containing protein [Pedosphaera parvula]|uniref:TPM domain-containing protein n=1 Tax=Pedosphaera parvula (strain Ellin514) TaxID=320771 RepID=B9XDI6_PEDPL|nr:TPM domain-containing protein [Pedosphaera parvula]EEF62132.1 protein of unknown function DUF477 [Pedosphaera parvula Ellin514]